MGPEPKYPLLAAGTQELLPAEYQAWKIAESDRRQRNHKGILGLGVDLLFGREMEAYEFLISRLHQSLIGRFSLSGRRRIGTIQVREEIPLSWAFHPKSSVRLDRNIIRVDYGYVYTEVMVVPVIDQPISRPSQSSRIPYKSIAIPLMEKILRREPYDGGEKKLFALLREMDGRLCAASDATLTQILRDVFLNNDVQRYDDEEPLQWTTPEYIERLSLRRSRQKAERTGSKSGKVG